MKKIISIDFMAEKNHKHVKVDDKYEALPDNGMSKERAAKISNLACVSKRENILTERKK